MPRKNSVRKNLNVNPKLLDLLLVYLAIRFPGKQPSVSAWVDGEILKLAKAQAPRLRRAGAVVPSELWD